MSLIELILSQKIIPLTIGVALLMILTALILAIVPRIRKHRAQRQAERERLIIEESAYDEPEKIRSAPARPASRSAAATAPVQSDVAAALLNKATTAPQPGVTPQSGEPTPSAMQDILSSVFSDDDNSERQAALMRGMTDVDISHLLTLSQQVVVQLHGGKTVTVVAEKELE